MKNSFTIPKVCRSEKRWYVWFRFNGEMIKISKGLNQILDENERLQEAEVLASAINLELKSGWIPNANNHILQKKRLVIALDDAMSLIEERLSKNTFDAYKTTVKFFKEALAALKFDRMNAEDFSRVHAKQSLDWIKTDRKWSNNSYNKNLKHIRAVYFEVLEAEQSNVNPFRDIKYLKVATKEANVPPTDAEMVLICDELRSKNEGFYIFYMVIYNCGIRPEELRNLKIKNLIFESKMIKLDAELTKTKKDRFVPMLGNVFDLLKPFENLNPEHYVFGVWCMNGGRHSQKNWFLPNKFRIKEDTPNKQWKKLIKDGLGIDKSLYSAKHKGADDKLEAGMSIETIAGVFGHSKEKMTERYLHSLHTIRMMEAMSVKMKDFS